MTDFRDRCYRALKQVPRGKVTTYAALARALGSRAHRAVGTAMRLNENAPKIPCHRVVRSNGELGGYAGGLQKKIRLLRSEGIPIRNGRVQELDRHLYRFHPTRNR